MIKISVIIPCFNHADYIRLALSSVAKQAKQIGSEKVEIIVVNDGSTDASAQVIKDFIEKNGHISILQINQNNAGAAAARNVALRKSRGKYIVFLDSDDVLAENQLQIQQDFMDSHPDVSVGYGTGHYIGNNDEINKRMSITNIETKIQGNVLEKLLLHGNFILIHSTIFDASIVKNDGIIFDETLQVLEDWDFWIRVSINDHAFMRIPGLNVPYRIHTSNISSTADRMAQNRLRVLQKYSSVINSDLRKPFQRKLLLATLALALRKIIARDKISAQDEIIRSPLTGINRVYAYLCCFIIKITPQAILASLAQKLICK